MACSGSTELMVIHASAGATISLPAGEITAVEVTGLLPFEYRLVSEAWQLALQLRGYGDWRQYSPVDRRLALFDLQYPCLGGTRGLLGEQVKIETRGLGAAIVVFVWPRG